MESSNGSQSTQGPRKSAKKRSPKNLKQKDSVVTTTNDFIEQEKITVKFELAPTPRMITLPSDMPRMENLTLNDLTGQQELIKHQSSVESSASSQSQERRAVTKHSKPKNIQINNHRAHHQQYHQHSGHAHSLEHVHQPHIHQHRHSQHEHLNHNNNNNNQHQHGHNSNNNHHHHQRHHKNKHSDQSQAKKSNNKGSGSGSGSNNQKALYEAYWDNDKIQAGLNDKTLLQGKLRINQRSFEDAFITDSNGGSDIYISGVVDRNRALNNDIVAVKLKEKYQWKILDVFRDQVREIVKEFDLNNPSTVTENNSSKKDDPESDAKNANNLDLITLSPVNHVKPELLDKLNNEWFQRTGIVVGIMEKKNSRLAAGNLKLFNDKNKDYALFCPNDSRVPRIRIKMQECPADFYTNSQFYANTLFIAQINEIPTNSKYATGELKKCIGVEGDIEVETEAILIENGIDYAEFDEQINECLPQVPWKIPDEEFTYRRDLRNMCIFTIDPATARDLDDALHCIKLSDDCYEIGVHIADVSYFVRENTLVDKYASERTTSVYLVQKVIPMLPRLLCEHLCSLNPATDRLTFSVIWKVNSNGDILEEWFGRTVINSAVKLSYEHAQMFIENPDKQFDVEQFPSIRSEFTLNDIKQCVLNLNNIALKLRQKRFNNGCLVLNQVKINFVLNRDSGLPYGYNIYQQKDSNRLVEEFMLLANIAVAHRIYDQYPNKAILRRHPTPNNHQLEQLGQSIRSYGFDCNVSSSNTIQAFLQTIQQKDSIASTTLTCLLTKTMQLAQYFCSGVNLTKDQFYHYGLAVPLYTHFTSPIRRYPDILVHRLLAASLGYCELTQRDSKQLQIMAEICNDKKYSARVCSEKSTEVYFSIFVNECGPFEETAVVTQIKDHSFDVLIVNLGISKRIYCDKLDVDQENIQYVKNDQKAEINFVWNANEKHTEKVEQKLELFSVVNVVLTGHDNDPLRFNISLKHPHDKLNHLNASKLLEQATNRDVLITQRIDTDPYICD